MKNRPVGRPSIFKKEAAKKIALDLFWMHGFEETSLTNLTFNMGINRSSFFRTFESKAALFESCVTDYINEHLSFIPAVLAKENIKDCVEEFFKSSIHLMTSHQPARGCLIVQGILNCAEDNQAISEELKEARKRIENMLRKRVQQAQVKAEIKAGQSAVDITKMLMTLYCGLSIQAASGTSQKELENATKLAVHAINF